MDSVNGGLLKPVRNKSDIDPSNLLHSRLRSRVPQQNKHSSVSLLFDDHLEEANTSAYPPRKPRVEEEKYQAKLPQLVTNNVGTTEKSMVLWDGNRKDITSAEVDDFLSFCRRVLLVERPEETQLAKEEDEMCLHFLHTCNYDLGKAKFALLSNLGIGLDSLWNQLQYNKLEEITKQKLPSNATASSSQLNKNEEEESIAAVEAATNGVIDETKVIEKKKLINWKKWVSRAKNICNGKSSSTRDTLFQVFSEANSCDSIPESASATFLTLLRKLEEVDDWIAQSHDALSLNKPDGNWNVVELKNLLSKKPKGVKIAEEEEINKWFKDWSELKARLQQAVEPDGKSEKFEDLLLLLEKSSFLPVDITQIKLQLKAKVDNVKGLMKRISQVLPCTKNWKATYTKKFWKMQSTAYLRELQREVHASNVLFYEQEILDEYLRRRDGWLQSARLKLRKGSSLKDLIAMIKEADQIPIDLTEEKREFDEQLKLAQDWLKRVKGAVPKIGKTRETSNIKKMDLETLQMFRDEASSLGLDMNEADNIHNVVEMALDWQNRIRQAVNTRASMETFRCLFEEGQQLPVSMIDEIKTLQTEISGMEWEERLETMLATKQKLKTLDDMLYDFTKLKRAYPASNKQENWKAEKENRLRDVLTVAKQWIRQAKALISKERSASDWRGLSHTRQQEIIKERQEALGPNFGLKGLQDLIEAGNEIPVDFNLEIEKLQRLKYDVEEQALRIQALLVCTGQQEGQGFKDSYDGSKCKDLIVENCKKSSFPLLDHEIAFSEAKGIETHETRLLNNCLDRANKWMQGYKEIFEGRVEKKRKREDGDHGMVKHTIDLEFLSELIKTASNQIVDLENEVKMLKEARTEADKWCKDASAIIQLYRKALQDCPVGSKAELYNDIIEGTQAGMQEKCEAREELVSKTLNLEIQSIETTFFTEFTKELTEQFYKGTVGEDQEMSHLNDFDISNVVGSAKTGEPQPLMWCTNIKEALSLIKNFIQDARRNPILPLLKSTQEFKILSWIEVAQEWCEKAYKCVVNLDSLNFDEAKTFILKGYTLVDPSFSTDKYMRESIPDFSSWKIAGLEGDTGQAVRSSKRARTNVQQNDGRVDNESEPIEKPEISGSERKNVERISTLHKPYISSNIDPSHVEGNDFKHYTGLGSSMLKLQDVLQKWTRRIGLWKHVAKQFLNTTKKSRTLGIIFKKLLEFKGKLGLNINTEEEDELIQELKTTKAWLEKAQNAINGKSGLLTSDKIDQLVNESNKLKTWLNEVKLLRNIQRAGKSWLSDVKKSGIEKGEASVERLQTLLEEAKSIKMDLSEHTAVLTQATRKYCLCRAPYDGVMIGCDECDEWYHAECINLPQKRIKRLGRYICPTCKVKRVARSRRALLDAMFTKVDLVLQSSPDTEIKNEKFLVFKSWLDTNYKRVFTDGKSLSTSGNLHSQIEFGKSVAGKEILAIFTTFQWCKNAIEIFKCKADLSSVEGLLRSSPSGIENINDVIELLTSIVARGKDWTNKALQVLNSPVEMPASKIVSDCKQLLFLCTRLPLNLHEEKLLAACVEDNAERYCTCRGFNDGTFMIGCDRCEEWFHGRCVNLTQAAGSKLTSWTCPSCLQKAQSRLDLA